jgi:hypothetical protein
MPIMAFSVGAEMDGSFAAIQRFVVIPLFLFGGAFYPLSQLPVGGAVDGQGSTAVARRRGRSRLHHRRRSTGSASPATSAMSRCGRSSARSSPTVACAGGCTHDARSSCASFRCRRSVVRRPQRMIERHVWHTAASG